MRIILFTGKGGVGKTTTAASVAVDAARAGIRTLVLSTDLAHSLLDAFGMAPQDSAGNEPLRLEPGLDALQVNGPHAVDASWRVVQEYLLEVLAAIGLDPLVAEELTELPGAEEIAALVELAARARSGRWDLVVVDCAPTAETLRLLALPEALAWHLDRLMPAQRALIKTLRPAAAAATGMPLPAPEVMTTVRSWHAEMREVHELLTGPTASVRLVVTPERVVLAESRRMWTSLSLHGFTVDQVVVNRVLPGTLEGSGEGSWLATWNAAQREGLSEVMASFAGLPIVYAPYLAVEPIGTDALGALAQATSGAAAGGGDLGADRRADRRADLLAPVARPAMRVSRRGVGYQLTLALPFADAADVDLKRRGADLLVAVGQHRRVLTLPSALQRCVVSSAAVNDGVLRVRFLPDERVWPRDDST